MTAPGGGAGLVAWLRGQVADRLADRLRAAETEGRPVTALPDRQALAAEVLRGVLDDYARGELDAGRAPLAGPAEEQISRQVLDGLFGAGGLQRWLDDPRVENLNCNGADNVWVRFADGSRAQVPPVAGSDDELVELVRTLAARSGWDERRFDRASPYLSVRLPDGSRLSAVTAVTARPCVSVRRHRYARASLAELEQLGTVSPGLRLFLRAAVLARSNLLVSGPTGGGKTTLLRALAAEVPAFERLVTVEDAAELGLDADGVHGDVVAMQGREANLEGEGEITLADLVRLALRLSPDRVIVGEVRGPEVVPMLNAMSQGNDGSLATVHASSAAGAFLKLAAYAAQSAERLPMEATNLLVASAVHFVVHLAHTRDGRRVVTSVREVTGADGLVVSSNEVWRPGPDGAAVPGVPLRGDTADRFAAAGWHGHDTAPDWNDQTSWDGDSWHDPARRWQP